MIIMVEGKQFSCACGFTVTSPLGEDDVMKYAEMHVNDIHSDMNPSSDDIRKEIRTVEMPMPKGM